MDTNGDLLMKPRTVQDLSERQWHIVHTMAQSLVMDEADANELGKVKAYLNSLVDHLEPGKHFLRYLQTLVNEGGKIGHSKQTKKYYQSMSDICGEYLKDDLDDIESIRKIIGWTFRLMRYYKDGIPPDQLSIIAEETASQEILSDRQKEIEETLQSVDIAEGQTLDAEITNKKTKGKQITYTLFGCISKTEKEPKENKFDQLNIGDMVKVRIDRLDDDGNIKKIKRIDP